MSRIIGPALPGMPWQDKPEGCRDVMWRFDQNPIVTRHNVDGARSIFNSAVVPFGDGYVGVFRVDSLAMIPTLHVGWSKDGINWDIEPEEIHPENSYGDVAKASYGFDPRVTCVDGKYYVSWCNVINGEGSTVGMAYTEDFKTFYQYPNVFPLYNRNAVLFPKKINGKFALLNRPTSRGHCVGGNIY